MGLTIPSAITTPQGIPLPTGTYLNIENALVCRAAGIIPVPTTSWVVFPKYKVYLDNTKKVCVFESAPPFIEMSEEELTASVHSKVYSWIKANVYPDATDC